MAKPVLPVPPFDSRHPFTRENKAMFAVKGIKDDGMGYCFMEEKALRRGILLVRLYPTRVIQHFRFGKLEAIESYWIEHLCDPVTGETIKEAEAEMCHVTNDADLIFFCAFLGIPIMGNMLNGLVRGPIMGFDTQPIVDNQGNWIGDVNYDTTMPADKEAYKKRQPQYEDTADTQPV